MKEDAVGVFMGHVHRRAFHLGVHVLHSQMHVIHTVEEVAEISTADLSPIDSTQKSVNIIVKLRFFWDIFLSLMGVGC